MAFRGEVPPSVRVPARAGEWIGRRAPLLEKGEPGERRGQVAVSEMALVCLLARRGALLGREGGPRDVVEICLEAVDHAYKNGIVFPHPPFYGDPGSFVGHLIIWLALRERSIDELFPRRRVQWLINHGHVVESERTPSRLLELRYFLDWGKFRHGLPPVSRIYRSTALASRGSLLRASESDFYSMTHVVPYATDFGRRTSSLFAGRNGARVRRKLRLMLGMAIRARHPDLIAELLMNLACLGKRERRWTEIGWAALAAAQNEAGWFNSPGAPRTRSGAADDEKETFLRRYHPVLMVLLAGLAERASSSPF